MPSESDPAFVASQLRLVLGQLIRRLRSEHRFPMSHAAVLGRIDREGAQSVADLAVAEGVRHQSMAQTVTDLEALGQVARRPDPDDRRRALVEMTDGGREALLADRERRVGWLANAIAEDLTPEEQALLGRAVVLLRRLAES